MKAIEFGALYDRQARDVFRFAVYLTGNRAEAEDLTSEAFVRAWAGAGAIRVGTVKAYLLTIVRNLHLDARRADARRGDWPADVADPAAGPARAAETRDELARVLAGLQQLPEVDRAALLMRSVEELSYEEIARALNLSAVAVRVRVHRARVRLAEVRGTTGVNA